MKIVLLVLFIVLLSACQVETQNNLPVTTPEPQNFSELLSSPVSSWCNNEVKPFFSDFLARASIVNFTGTEIFQGIESCRLDVKISEMGEEIALRYYISNNSLCTVFQGEVKCGEFESFEVS